MELDELSSALDTRSERGGWFVPGLTAVSVEPGHVVARVEVGDALVNMAQTLHGGAAATLVDVVGTIAIASLDQHHRVGVSTDLNVSWFAPAMLGETVRCDATVLKTGRTLAFVQVDLRRESDDVLVVQGRMTKVLGPAPTG